MASLANGSATKVDNAKITLYTNHKCPWAHRAHIALRELGLPYEEVIIPLDRPREPWYLEVNPRGLVPTIKYSSGDGAIKDQIITESSVVSRFLTDAHPSHLVPVSNADGGRAALFRARADFFVDTWVSKLGAKLYSATAAEGQDKERIAGEIVDAVTKEIEPLLEDAKPFFGGSERLTIAEVLVASFVVRLHSYSKEGSLLPASVNERLDKLQHFGKWSAALRGEESVMYVYDEEENVQGTKARIAKLKAANAAK